MNAPQLRAFATFLLLLAFAGCASVPPEQQLIREVAEALGGVERVRAAGVMVLEGTGRQWNLGQDLRPGLADQTFTVSAFQRVVDTGAPRMRTTLTRTPNFAYFQGPQAQTQVQGVDGDVAYNVGASGTPARASVSTAADRRAERLHHPLVLVALALQDGAGLSPVRVNGAERALDVTTPAGAITLVVGAEARPVRIESPGTQHQPRRRASHHHLCRLRGSRRRAAAADPLRHQGGRLHDRRVPGDVSHGHREPRPAGRAGRPARAGRRRCPTWRC